MVYSNFGYCILGCVIEKVSGQNYETYVREEVLAPLGISTMRLGKTLLEQRLERRRPYVPLALVTDCTGRILPVAQLCGAP
jgi:CubicO group peptidase (beta-lactamase class C family)